MTSNGVFVDESKGDFIKQFRIECDTELDFVLNEIKAKFEDWLEKIISDKFVVSNDLKQLSEINRIFLELTQQNSKYRTCLSNIMITYFKSIIFEEIFKQITKEHNVQQKNDTINLVCHIIHNELSNNKTEE